MAVAPTTRRKVSVLVCGLSMFDLRIELRAVGRAALILQSGDDDVSGQWRCNVPRAGVAQGGEVDPLQ